MFEIVKAERLTRETTRMEFFAPAIAHKALPGQFVMLRVDDRVSAFRLLSATKMSVKAPLSWYFRR